MKQSLHLTAVIEREGDGFVSFCPELDVASQGDTIEEARANLVEAVELFLEVADESEISARMSRKPREPSPAASVEPLGYAVSRRTTSCAPRL
jgi:predicted RNase H-like HicB family nuclease